MPRLRIKIRWLMVLVAAVAIPMGVLVERHRRFLRLSHHHRSMAWRGAVPVLDKAGREVGHSFVVTAPPAWRWHFALSNKYLGAASRPWLPVAPDPPEPR